MQSTFRVRIDFVTSGDPVLCTVAGQADMATAAAAALTAIIDSFYFASDDGVTRSCGVCGAPHSHDCGHRM